MKKAVTLNEVFPLINEQLLAGGSASFITHGISMKPLLRDGCDTVYLEKPKGKIKKYDVVIVTHPIFNCYLPKNCRVIYECMDNMPAFYTGKKKEFTEKWQKAKERYW